MFLFEKFQYDPEWAKANYTGFRSSSFYLSDQVNDHDYVQTLGTREEREKYLFSVNKITGIPGVDNIYQVQDQVWPKQPLDKNQIAFIEKNLNRNLKDCTKVLSTDYDNGLLFAYDIENDEYRWNMQHARIKAQEEKEASYRNFKMPEPDINDWMFILTAYYTGKNPRIIFKKFGKNNDKDTLKKYYFIACKLNWNAGKVNIRTALCGIGYRDREEAEIICQEIEKYAKFYEVSDHPDIQEMIDAYDTNFKNKKNIPVKAKPIAALLDNDRYIKDYQIFMPRKDSKYAPLFEIEVNTADGKKVWIVIKYYDQTYTLKAYQTRNIITTKFGSSYTEYKNEISKHIYMVFKMRFGNTSVNGTLQNLLDTYWNYLMDDIKEYEMKEE